MQALHSKLFKFPPSSACVCVCVYQRVRRPKLPNLLRNTPTMTVRTVVRGYSKVQAHTNTGILVQQRPGPGLAVELMPPPEREDNGRLCVRVCVYARSTHYIQIGKLSRVSGRLDRPVCPIVSGVLAKSGCWGAWKGPDTLDAFI